jgi:hypothetical protein
MNEYFVTPDRFTPIGRIKITETNVKEITVPIFVPSTQNDTSFLGQASIAAQWYGDKAYFTTSPIVLVQVSNSRSAQKACSARFRRISLRESFLMPRKVPMVQSLGSSSSLMLVLLCQLRMQPMAGRNASAVEGVALLVDIRGMTNAGST